MKKLMLFTYFFAIVLSQGKAQQQYQSIFGNETTQWITTNRFIIPEDAWMDTISVIDTENEYKILELRSKWSGNNQFIGKIRTNETNSKLYFIEPDSTTELLIMDLDLAVGDSFNIKTYYNQNRIIYVDSVYEFNRKKHIQFDELAGISNGTKKMFIEGVGTNWGFESDYTYLIVCKYDDLIQTYSFENEYIKDCSFKNVNINNYIWKDNIKIYPNPAFEQIIINISETLTEDIYLSIYNTLGVKVLNKTLSDSETVLNLSHFSTGLYYFKFQTSNTMTIKKIVKF